KESKKEGANYSDYYQGTFYAPAKEALLRATKQLGQQFLERYKAKNLTVEEISFLDTCIEQVLDEMDPQITQEDFVNRNKQNLSEILGQLAKRVEQNSEEFMHLHFTRKVNGQWTKLPWHVQTAAWEPRTIGDETKEAISHFVPVMPQFQTTRTEVVFTRPRRLEEILAHESSRKGFKMDTHWMPNTITHEGVKAPWMDYFSKLAKTADKSDWLSGISPDTPRREITDIVSQVLDQAASEVECLNADGEVDERFNYALTAKIFPTAHYEQAGITDIYDENGHVVSSFSKITHSYFQTDRDNVRTEDTQKLNGFVNYFFEEDRRLDTTIYGHETFQGKVDFTGPAFFNINTAFEIQNVVFNQHKDGAGGPRSSFRTTFPQGCNAYFNQSITELTFYDQYLETQDSYTETAITRRLAKASLAFLPKSWGPNGILKSSLSFFTGASFREYGVRMGNSNLADDEKTVADKIVRYLYHGILDSGIAGFLVPLAILAIVAPLFPAVAPLAFVMGWYAMRKIGLTMLTKQNGFGLLASYKARKAFKANPNDPLAAEEYRQMKRVLATNTKELITYAAVMGFLQLFTMGFSALFPPVEAFSLGPPIAQRSAEFVAFGLAALFRTKYSNIRDAHLSLADPEFHKKYYSLKRASKMRTTSQLERTTYELLKTQGYHEALEDSFMLSTQMIFSTMVQSINYQTSHNPRESSSKVKQDQFTGRWITYFNMSKHRTWAVRFAQKVHLHAQEKTINQGNYVTLFLLEALMPIFSIAYLLFNSSILSWPVATSYNLTSFTDIGFGTIFALISIMNTVLMHYLHAATIRNQGFSRRQASMTHAMTYFYLRKMIENDFIVHKAKYQIFTPTIDHADAVNDLAATSYAHQLMGFNMFKRKKDTSGAYYLGWVRTMLQVGGIEQAILASRFMGGAEGNPITNLLVSSIMSFWSLRRSVYLETAEAIGKGGASHVVKLSKQRELNTLLRGWTGPPRIALRIMTTFGILQGLQSFMPFIMDSAVITSAAKWLAMGLASAGAEHMFARLPNLTAVKLKWNKFREARADFNPVSAYQYYKELAAKQSKSISTPIVGKTAEDQAKQLLSRQPLEEANLIKAMALVKQVSGTQGEVLEKQLMALLPASMQSEASTMFERPNVQACLTNRKTLADTLFKNEEFQLAEGYYHDLITSQEDPPEVYEKLHSTMIRTRRPNVAKGIRRQYVNLYPASAEKNT
ncbi:MAG: hypothetical protein AABZ14_00315, partial [Candidatus Margulisiibacteriota bacterium]